jgi:hypothetical protein
MGPVRVLVIALVCLAGAAAGVRGDDGRTALRTRNVVLVTADGLRWQEVFRGADPALLDGTSGGVADAEAVRRAFWRDTPEARREALLPFVWGVIARRGQLYGNADKGSPARATNGKNFSYPGYNELLTGAPDPRIDSNDKRPNPNATVLEWLHGKPAYRGRVAVIGSWDVFPYILNRGRSGLTVNAGWEPFGGEAPIGRAAEWNRLMRQLPHRWKDCRDDAITFPAALEYLHLRTPRVLYIACGDTDEHGHEGRYDLVLDAAHELDADLGRLWETLQALPQYRDATTLVVTTDHGRGDAPEQWKHHGAEVRGSERVWVAILGPDTPPLGVRAGAGEVSQAQVAATVAALLGEDYNSAFPRAARPVAGAIAGGS